MQSRSSFAVIVASLLALSAGCSSGSKQFQAIPASGPEIQAHGELISRGAYTFAKYSIPTARSGANRIVTGPDGALWFTEQGAAKLGRVTTTGSFKEIQMVSGTAPSHVASAYGQLWVTDANLFQINAVTPAGTITQYQAASSTRGVAGGVGERIWFTEFEAGYVSILDISTGASAEYVVPTRNALPYEVAFGGNPDQIWFTEYGASKIGRMTATGSFTQFATRSQPQSLVFGPDGALWFTETSANKIGRMTMTGTETDYALPTQHAGPVAIAAGPDGALWFTEYTASKIGRITTSGRITETPTPDAHANPVGITTGPDHHIWFVENRANAIVRLL